MNGDELRAIQAPLRNDTVGDDKAGLVTLKQWSLSTPRQACRSRRGERSAVAGLHTATGGSARLCSGEMLLEAL